MQLAPRDCEIIRLIHRHRFLRSDQLWLLIDGSRQQMLRRLQLLFHHGYLERPLAQINSYYRSGSRYLAYGLGRKGEQLLEQQLGITVDTAEKDLAVGQLFIDHTLMVADVMVAIELACRKHNGIRLLYEDELMLPVARQPFQWQVTIQSGEKLGVVPDRVFALDLAGKDGQPDRAYFFLEADRGTMPVKRHSLLQTSFFRKLLAYEGTWAQDIHQRKLGISRFRVLTVTKSPQRVKSLIAACRELKRGHGLFLFADKTILSDDPFSPVWQNGKSGEIVGLLN